MDQKCVPFVSTYTDCNEENKCDGCERCTCSAEGKWQCETVKECTKEEEEDIREEDLNRALDLLVYDIQNHETIAASTFKTPYVPQPLSKTQIETLLGEPTVTYKYQYDSEEMKKEDEVLAYFVRGKRSIEENKNSDEKDNGTITFHHTVDEINEDTLKKSNTSGTLKVNKVELLPKASRRTALLNNSSSKSLQIDYEPPLNQHAADNKVDTLSIHDDKEDLMIHHEINELSNKHNQTIRDKELSKLVVNELKGGEETIGDRNSQVISNITFTSENDTLTAMTFIAGNLLNKLWNIEKDASDNSLETEKIKHEKINSLLELFKEPLNLRQETFLRNALVELSTAMEKKDLGNISLCKNIDEFKRVSGYSTPNESISPKEKSAHIEENLRARNESNDKSLEMDSTTTRNPEENTAKINKEIAIMNALNKINKVLNLIKKYEEVQDNLSDIKSNSKSKIIPLDNEKILYNKTIQDEKTTLKTFGNILQSLTTLLIPNKKSKKMIRGLNRNNMLSSDKNIRERFQDFDLGNMPLSTKDKIVLDYITHIQNSPSCIHNKQKEKYALPNIEGDILLNLSEFFKMKSLSDLLKLVDSNKSKLEDQDDLDQQQYKKQYHLNQQNIKEPTLRLKTNILKSSDVKMADGNFMYTTENTNSLTEKAKKTKIESTKDKLKLHLRTILEDLVELQNISGKTTNGKNIEIAKALPCIYNLFNINRSTQYQPIPTLIPTFATEKPQKVKLSKQEQVNKVADIVNKVKKELKKTVQTRRMSTGSKPRPKSAIVWERTLKNIDHKNKRQNRRTMTDEAPKSLSSIIKMIDEVDSTESNTYKSEAYINNVPPAEKLLLLKTLSVDAKKYINILKDVIKSIEIVTEIPTDLYITIAEFNDNVNINFNLSHKIIKHVNEPRQDIYLSNLEANPAKRFKIYKTAMEVEEATIKANVIKLTRDQVINQLIKNRMLHFIRMKEATGENKKNFITDLARKILLHLEIGNNNLARELYKMFLSTNNKNSSYSDKQGLEKYGPVHQQKINRRIADKVPLIDFVDPTSRSISWSNREQLIKQLVNIKNMRV